MFNDFYYSLSEKEIIIFDFISSNISQICNMTIKEFGVKLNITEYSVNKFCKKINVDNYDNLISILKYISKNSYDSSNYIFKTTMETFFNFLNKIDESQIEKMCNLILDHNNLSVFYLNSSKLIGEYLNENLNNLNIKSKLVPLSRQNINNSTSELIILIGTSIEEHLIKKLSGYISEKTVITLLDKVIKEVHDNSTIFINIENNKLYGNFNLHSTSSYFIFCDLLIAKLIQIHNNKN